MSSPSPQANCRWVASLIGCDDYEVLRYIIMAGMIMSVSVLGVGAAYVYYSARRTGRASLRTSPQDVLLAWLSVAVMCQFGIQIVLASESSSGQQIQREALVAAPWSLGFAGIISYIYHLLLVLPLFSSPPSSTTMGVVSTSSIRRMRSNYPSVWYIFYGFSTLTVIVLPMALGMARGLRVDNGDTWAALRWDRFQIAIICALASLMTIIMVLGGGALISRAREGVRACRDVSLASNPCSPHPTLPNAIPSEDQAGLISRSVTKMIVTNICITSLCGLTALGTLLDLILPRKITASVDVQRIAVLNAEVYAVEEHAVVHGMPLEWEAPESEVSIHPEPLHSHHVRFKSEGGMSTSMGSESHWNPPTTHGVAPDEDTRSFSTQLDRPPFASGNRTIPSSIR